jgi:hypothetical protein
VSLRFFRTSIREVTEDEVLMFALVRIL